MLETAEKFEFGPFVLEPDRHALSASGKAVTLHGRAFDVLELLVRERERVLSQKEILEKVWGGQRVDPRNLTVQISALRTALAAHPGGSRLIHTIPNRGYRFIGEVSVRKPAPAPVPLMSVTTAPAPPTIPATIPLRPPDARRRFRPATLAWSLGVLALLLTSGIASRRYFGPSTPAAPRLSIAVLPFRNASPDRSQDYLADAVTDDLISDLAHIPASTVIARETAEAVRTDPPQRIGRELHVRYVLAGTLARQDDKYLLAAHLIDAATGAQLWDASYAEPKNTLSAARDNIVQHIASALHLRLDELESIRSLHDRPDNPDALDLFFRARAILDDDDSRAALAHAQELLEQALVMEPEFADAGAQLSWLLLKKALYADDEITLDRDWLRTRSVIDDTLRIAPRDAMAIAAKARQLFVEGKYREAETVADTALSINASSVEAYWALANCSWMLGQLEKELVYLSDIRRLNPEGMDSKREYLLLGIVHVLQQKPAEAIDYLQHSIVGDPEPVAGAESFGRAETARVWLIAAYAMNHDLAAARAAYQDYARLWPNRSVWRFGAYQPRAVTALPSAKLVLQALQDAGMPQIADETKARASPDATCGPDIYDPTPTTLAAGGQVATTADVDRLLQARIAPMVIDLGEGKDSIPIAHWYDPAGPAETRTQFALRLAASVAPPLIPIIVLSDGPFGCSSYDAADALVSRGHRNVYWYRGGEEAWANSAHTVKDFRPE